MKHLIATANSSGLPIAEYDRVIFDSSTNDVIIRGRVTYEVVPDSYIYNEADDKYYQKLVGYGKPIELNDIDLNSEWVLDSEDDKYNYFRSESYEVEEGSYYSQCKVTWSNLTSITFKYMSNRSSDMGGLIVLKMDSEKFTLATSPDDIHLTTADKTPETYDEFTIECDKSEHHIWFCYMKMEGATGEECGFIGVPKFVSPILDVKQGSELPMEYKSGGVSAEDNKTYDINFNSVILPNGSYIVPSYEDYTKTEKTITYEYVDLGLPSRLKWATCNIGATSETENGVYFQWGETSGVSEALVGKYSDENYSWASYTLCNGTYKTMIKYCTNIKYGTVDNITTLESVDDAATQIMGNEWRMPTETECRELSNNTTKTWVKNFNGSGVDGCIFTSKKDTSKYIFIPATGQCDNGLVNNVGSKGYVWSSSLDTSYPYGAEYFNFVSDKTRLGYESFRYLGVPVRGVRN